MILRMANDLTVPSVQKSLHPVEQDCPYSSVLCDMCYYPESRVFATHIMDTAHCGFLK